MAQYFQLVHGYDELKRIYPNINIELVSTDDIQFGQQQVILTQDSHGLVINETQTPQIIYQQQPENQLQSPTQTHYLIREEDATSDNFVPSQQVYYTSEVSNVHQQQIVDTRQLNQSNIVQQGTHTNETLQQQVVIQHIQQQQQQTQQQIIVQQSPPQQSQVIVQNTQGQQQQHIVVQNSQQNHNQIVLQTSSQGNNIVTMNNSNQQHRHIIYNTNQNIIYEDSIQQGTIINQPPALSTIQRPMQQRTQVIQTHRNVQQQQTIRHQNPQTRIVQQRLQQPQLQQQIPQLQQAGQHRVIIAHSPIHNQQIQQRVTTPRPRQTYVHTPRPATNIRAQQNNARQQRPHLAVGRLPNPQPQQQQQIIRYSGAKSLQLANSRQQTPQTNIQNVNRVVTTQQKICQVTKSSVVAQRVTANQHLPTTVMTPPIVQQQQQQQQQQQHQQQQQQLHQITTVQQFQQPVQVTQKKPSPKFSNTPNVSIVKTPAKTPSKSVNDFDALDDLENSITAAIVSKNACVTLNSDQQQLQQSQALQNQEEQQNNFPIADAFNTQKNNNSPIYDLADNKKLLTLGNGKRISYEEYRRQQLKYGNRNVAFVAGNNRAVERKVTPQKARATPAVQSIQTIENDVRGSAKMLVILESGEQRLITFTLPKESCTVQDLLEQVGISFTTDTNIQCVSNPGANIDYVVTVGVNVQDAHTSELVSAAESSLEADKKLQQQRTALQLQQQQLQLLQNQQQQQPEQPLTPQQIEEPVEEKQKSPETPKEPPAKIINGFLAVCGFCGYSGIDHAKCQRCRRIFTEEPKRTCYLKSGDPKIKERRDIDISVKKQMTAEIIQRALNVRGRGSGRGRGRGRSKAADIEPVILTLSSDEENDSESPQAPRVPSLPSPTITDPMPFEPTIPEKDDVNSDFVRENVADVTKSVDKLYTTLQCLTIRIGTLKYDPIEKVIFSSKGIRIIAPNVKDRSENVILDIQAHEVIKIVSHYSRTLSVLFIYVLPSCGYYVRESLEMGSTDKGPFFNPVHKNDFFRRIILQMESISEESKSVIRSIYSTTVLEEISARDALELLNRSSSKDQILSNVSAGSSQNENIRQILIYPQGKGGISINTEDYICLGTDQYLNDIIIDFFLNYLRLEVMTDAQRNKTHIFSSFFYKRLTTTSTRQRQSEKDAKLSASQKRHERVKSWTKNVNIFDKDFIIIPINEQSHWFLAIICFPGLKGAFTLEGNIPVKNTPLPKKKSEKKHLSLQIGSTTITPVSKREVDSIYNLNEDSLSERDEAEGDDSEMASDESDDEIDISLQPIKQSCILIFDSLAGASRSRVVATLRDYLTCEYKAKIYDNSTRVFNKGNIPGNSVKVPQQNNFTDCGLYLLQYVEHFFKDPITDYRLPIKQLTSWFDAIVVTRKREEISNLLKELVSKYNPDHLPLPEISFPTLNGKLVEPEETFNEENVEFEEEELEENIEEQDGVSETEEDTSIQNESESSPEKQNGERKRTFEITKEPIKKKLIKLSKPDL